MEEDWVRARAAIRRLHADDMLSSRDDGMPAALIDWAAGGVLRARAGRLVELTEPIVDGEELGPDDWVQTESQNAPVPVWVWNLIVKDRPENCNWLSGTVRGYVRYPDRIENVEVYDLQFARADLDHLLGAPEGSSSPGELPPQRSAVGAPRKDAEWTAFWHAVLEIALAGRLTTDAFPTQAELRREILAMIGDSLSDGSVRTPVRQIWKKFVAADG